MRRKLAALCDEIVVPDQILGGELCRLVGLHVSVGSRIGPIAAQCAKSSPDARIRCGLRKEHLCRHANRVVGELANRCAD